MKKFMLCLLLSVTTTSFANAQGGGPGNSIVKNANVTCGVYRSTQMPLDHLFTKSAMSACMLGNVAVKISMYGENHVSKGFLNTCTLNIGESLVFLTLRDDKSAIDVKLGKEEMGSILPTQSTSSYTFHNSKLEVSSAADHFMIRCAAHYGDGSDRKAKLVSGATLPGSNK